MPFKGPRKSIKSGVHEGVHRLRCVTSAPGSTSLPASATVAAMRAKDSCAGPSVRIRRGRVDDADTLVALYAREPAVSDFDGLHTPERFQHLARSRSAILLVAECGGRVMGALDAEIYAESRFSYFANIVVARGQRGRGVGAQLMARYEESCRRRGVTTILALVYDWNRDMHRVMRRKRSRTSGKLGEYIKKL